MTAYYNADTISRIWPFLNNPATGTTLELDPAEEVDLDLTPNTAPEGEPSNGFEDPFLKPVPDLSSTAKPTFYTPPTTEAAKSADSPEE